MEQPLRRNQFDMNESLAGDAGKLDGHSDVPRKAGHILLHESPHGGEISLHQSGGEQQDPATQVARTEVPAWYNVKFNAMDQVVEQQYGQAFQQEQKPEQVGDQGASAALAAVRTAAAQPLVPAVSTDTTTPAHAAVVAPVPQVSDTSLTAANPIYNAMAHPIQAAQPQPIDQPQTTPMPALPVDIPAQQLPVPGPLSEQPTQPDYFTQYQQPTQQFAVPEQPASQQAMNAPVALADPAHQQLSQSPMGGQPTYFQTPQPTTTMSGAVNPSFAQPMQPALPTAPQYAEPRLPEGTPKRVDPQHLLPAAKKHAAKYLQNPWVWLAVGLLLIFYFVRSI